MRSCFRALKKKEEKKTKKRKEKRKKKSISLKKLAKMVGMFLKFNQPELDQ